MKENELEMDLQIDNELAELDRCLQDAGGVIMRIERLKTRLTAEVNHLREQRDAFEIYTESEAASLLKIETKHLGDLRRRHNLPHCSFGNKPRWTKEQLIAVCAVFEINSKGKTSMKRKA